MEAVQAVAEAWASIDGKLEAYLAESPGSFDPGHRDGYNIEAAELIQRIERRGYILVPVPVVPLA
jgi:hypothetical protein